MQKELSGAKKDKIPISQDILRGPLSGLDDRMTDKPCSSSAGTVDEREESCPRFPFLASSDSERLV
jgi:hypothetical protein